MTGGVPITRSSCPETLLHQVRHLVENRPDSTALVLIRSGEPDQALSTRTFFENAARYARALEDKGVGPGDLVVLVLQHGGDVLYGFWGALMLGAVPSIFPFLTGKLDPDIYFDSVKKLIARENVRLVITYEELAPDLWAHIAPTGVDMLTTDNLAPDGGDGGDWLYRRDVEAGDTAFLQHSSGSTGLQKGVMLSHRSVINQVAAYSEAIALAPDDVVVSWLPLYHDMGLIAGFIMPILQGVPLVLMSPFHWVRQPQVLLEAITRYEGTLCWLPNFAYNFMATRIRDAALEGVDLGSVRAFVNCSEPVYAESHRNFLERYGDFGARAGMLTVSYAMAENTFAVTQTPVGEPARVDIVDRPALMEERRAEPVEAGKGVKFSEITSCGPPIPGCEIRIVGEDGEDLPERRVGEIALRSDSMLTGYYRNPEATEAAFEGGWYFTGDMGYIADGEIYITGRKKDLIIVGGKNIYPQDIENLLNDIEGVHPGRVVAFGVPNESLGTEDIAVLAEAETADRKEQAQITREIRARVAQSTDAMARHVRIVPPRWLIKTSSGKIARRANRQKFLDEILNT